MTARSPLHSSRFLNAILALGVLMGLGGLAGLVAGTLSGPARPASEAEADRSIPVPTRIDGKYGYVDVEGKVVIAPRFDGADTFSEGLALVLERGRFGYIDPGGKFAIPAVFRHALPFRNGFAAVRNGRDWAFLDRRGNPIAYRESDGDSGEPAHQGGGSP